MPRVHVHVCVFPTPRSCSRGILHRNKGATQRRKPSQALRARDPAGWKFPGPPGCAPVVLAPRSSPAAAPEKGAALRGFQGHFFASQAPWLAEPFSSRETVQKEQVSSSLCAGAALNVAS